MNTHEISDTTRDSCIGLQNVDGTLLNRHSKISDYMRDTLRLLSERNIAYTVATGRTLPPSIVTAQCDASLDVRNSRKINE